MRDFELLSYREFELRWYGYQRREQEKWRHTREILAYLANSRMGVKKMITGREIMPFESEKKEVTEQSFVDLVNLLKK